jgi:hypothetical protein
MLKREIIGLPLMRSPKKVHILIDGACGHVIYMVKGTLYR